MATRRKTTAPTPAPPNISAIARKHGVSRETIRKLRENGVNLASEKAVADGLAASKAQVATPSPADGSETYSEARRRREIANANRAEILAAKESGSVIEVAEVAELMTRLGSEMRSRLLSWVGTLPPMFEGLSAARIQPILLEKVAELLAAIHENSPIKSKP